jgi:hypothetical protein
VSCSRWSNGACSSSNPSDNISDLMKHLKNLSADPDEIVPEKQSWLN